MVTVTEAFANTWALIVLLFRLSYMWPWAIIKSFLPKKQKDINNEIMFITGAGCGIGRGMAIKFAELGATIICTDINKESSDETAQMIAKAGGKAYSYKLDVSDRQKVYAVAETVRSEVGDVTMLVNNAGIVTGKKFMDCPDELMIKTVEVNTIAHFWTLKAFLGPMIKKNHGHVISIASVAGYCASPSLIDYCASKFGAVGLQESLQMELFDTADKIKTTTVCPWFINTGMFKGTVSKSPITLPIQEPDDVVNQIVEGVRNDDQVIFVPGRLMIIVIAHALLPADRKSVV